MDQTQLQQKIAEYYSKLPTDLQQVFSSMSWMETLKTLNSKYTLNNEQVSILATETTLVLLGIINTNEYEEVLKQELKLSQDSFVALMQEIDEMILKSIRIKLNETQKINAESLSQKSAVDLDPRFSSLPENLQEAIANSNYQQKIYDIGAKYKLLVPQIASLEETTIQFMIGKISSSKYESDLALTTDLEATKISEIAKEVNDTILVNIREYMKNGSISGASMNEDIEVPIPPYKTTTKEEEVPQAPNTPIKSTTILQNNNAPKSGRGIFVDAGIEMMEEGKALTNTGFIGDKLFAPTKTTNTVSNQTIPKITTSAEPSVPSPNNTTPKTKDPYHEEI